MQCSLEKLSELHSTITKMPLNECCMMVLPEFGVRWHDMSRAVRNARLPMRSSSIADVLCRRAATVLPQDELEDILGRIKLKLVSIQIRMWHVVNLLEPTNEDSPIEILRTLPHRVVEAIRSNGKIKTVPEVQSIKLGSLVYLSITQMSPGNKAVTLFMATAGQSLALFSTTACTKLVKVCVQALGFNHYEYANLHGKDIPSLLRIANPVSNGRSDHLTNLPPYQPTPCILPNGIDYTNKTYDENYVNEILGPNPPLLTDLNIKMAKNFYNENVLNKIINLQIKLKSDNVAESLKAWASKGRLAPNSKLFQIFHSTKANDICYNDDTD